VVWYPDTPEVIILYDDTGTDRVFMIARFIVVVKINRSPIIKKREMIGGELFEPTLRPRGGQNDHPLFVGIVVIVSILFLWCAPYIEIPVKMLFSLWVISALGIVLNHTFTPEDPESLKESTTFGCCHF
jgi:hypothetical protein